MFLRILNEFRYGKKSYSQSGEDLLVVYVLKYVLERDEISYLDIGCNHPYKINNTILLRDIFKVKKGILVEPNPELEKKLRRARKKDIILNKGIGVKNDWMKYYMMSVDTLNTFSKEEAELAVEKGYRIEKSIDIEVLDINELLHKEFMYDGLDFLSIDIEGIDFKILQSIEYDKIRPTVICVETVEFMGGKEEEMNSIVSFLTSQDYMIYADTWINTIFVDRRAMANGHNLRTILDCIVK